MPGGLTTFEDVIYYNDRFYAITWPGELVSFNVTNSSSLDVKLLEIDYDDDDNDTDEENDDDKDDDDDDEHEPSTDDEGEHASGNDHGSDDDGDLSGNLTKRYLVETCDRELWQGVKKKMVEFVL